MRIHDAVQQLKDERPEGYMEQVYILRTECAIIGHRESHPGKCWYCGAKL